MNCPNCQRENHSNANFCLRCGAKLFTATLKHLDSGHFEDAYYLLPQTYYIGRDKTNQIILAGSEVSRRHAQLDFEHGQFVLRDRGSKNGTLVNRKLILQQELQHGDIIQIGSEKYVFHHEKSREIAPGGVEDQTIGRILKVLSSINQTFHSHQSLEEILSLIIDSVIEITRFQRGYLILYNNKQQPEFTIARNLDRQSLPTDSLKISSTAIKKAIETAELVVVEAIPMNAEFSEQKSVLNLKLMSLVCIPIVAIGSNRQLDNFGFRSEKKTILGIIYVDSQQTTQLLSPRRKDILQTLSDQAALAIENAILFRENIAKRQLDQELELANKIQQNLLPAVNYHSAELDIAGLNLPCKQIGGDYYDFFNLKNTKLGVAIADVCGKGIPAALLMSSLQATLNSQIKYVDSLEEIVTNLNLSMMENSPSSRFVTLFIGLFENLPYGLKYISCGHNPVLHLKPNGDIRLLKSSGIPLGIMDPPKFEANLVSLEAGDYILLYTDGITEAANLAQQSFGMERLQITCRKLIKQNDTEISVEMFIEEIISAIDEFTEGAEQKDDITLMAIKIK